MVQGHMKVRQSLQRGQKAIERERGKTDGKIEFEGGRRRRSAKGIFAVCLERMGASYAARSGKLARARASSR